MSFMEITSDIAGTRARRRREPGKSWGFVPTMGFLHEAHLSLVRRARRENDRVAVSIFVNPTQFNDAGDFEHYPRSLEADLEMLRQEGVHLVFTPPVEVVYPPGFQTWVDVQEVSKDLEGASRPGHFRGVATVLARLFLLLEPHRAYLGQKDAQQVVVVERMVRDLGFDLEVVRCATLREDDGLAMSSRNARLSSEERAAAPAVYAALRAARDAFVEGERQADALRAAMRKVLEAEPLARIDYLSIADPTSLEELEVAKSPSLASLAVFFGDVRLIDNLILEAG